MTEKSHLSQWSTSALVCAPFLDTSFDPEYRAAMLLELRRRGYIRPVVFLLRVVAGLGLWWNVIAWEWVDLDLYDVLFGYAIHFAVAAAALVLAALYVLATGASWRDSLGVGAVAAVSASISLFLVFVVRRASARTRSGAC